MKITVTKKHFERGLHHNPRNCPVAIAVNEACPTHEAEVWKGDETIVLYPLLAGPPIIIRIVGGFESDVFKVIEDFEYKGGMKKSEYVLDIAIPELTTSGKGSAADSVSDARSEISPPLILNMP